MKHLLKSAAVFILLLFTFIACSDSASPETTGTINLSSKYSTAVLSKSSAAGVTITKATYILREIKFKTAKDSTEGIYKTTPLVLELNTSGNVQNVGGLKVPFGTYNRLEFDIHRAEANDTTAMSSEERAKIRPFFAGDKYSVIIEGIYNDGTTQKNFVYKSKINMKQKIDLPQPLVVTENENTINATMLISSYDWFKDNNTILDPTDSKNSSKIDNNIKSSIKAVRDKNKDGAAD